MTQSRTTFLCDSSLLQTIRKNVNQFEARSLAKDGYKQAAVALTIVDASHGTDVYGLPTYKEWNSEAALILTKRNARLKNHSGQWALPGGRREAGETLEETALRELGEEVGLTLSEKRVIGRLDDYATRSGFVITPVVVWGGPGLETDHDPAEVHSVHRIRVAEFMREDAPILHETPDAPNPTLLMPVGDSWIAAPTAAMLYQFREVALLGRGTRVAHYEQPFFAWR